MKSIPYYILDERGLAIQVDRKTWLAWHMVVGEQDRFIARTEIHHCTISTVFLCFSHQFDNGLPLLFETMVFQGEGESTAFGKPIQFEGSEAQFFGDCRRYSFKCDALEGHKQAVLAVEKQFGQVQEKVSGLIYGIMNAEEWVRETQ